MRDLLLVVPSRGRPGNIRRLREAMWDTCQAKTDLLVGFDEDDATRSEAVVPWVYFQLLSGRHGVVAGINELARSARGEHRFIGHIGDDNVPRTKGWDLRVIEALAEVPMCFGDDLFPRPKGTLPCHIFMRSEIIQALGYMGPPAFTSMYVDNVWMAWGNAVGIKFLPDVVIEHMHPYAGKAEIDSTYTDSWQQMRPGREVFERYMSTDYAGDVAKIKAVL